MATTSYTTGGAPVAASATYPTPEADATMLGATGAGGATTSEQTVYDAVNHVAGTGTPAGAPQLAPYRCGWLCAVVAAGVILYIAGKL